MITEARKQQLYDNMVSHIYSRAMSCGNLDLYDAFCGDIGMTKEELHEHGIDSIDYFFEPIFHVETAVMKRYGFRREETVSDPEMTFEAARKFALDYTRKTGKCCFVVRNDTNEIMDY